MSATIAPAVHGPWSNPDPETARIIAAHQRAARDLCVLGVFDKYAFPAFRFRAQGPRYRFNLPYQALTEHEAGRFARLSAPPAK